MGHPVLIFCPQFQPPSERQYSSYRRVSRSWEVFTDTEQRERELETLSCPPDTRHTLVMDL